VILAFAAITARSVAPARSVGHGRLETTRAYTRPTPTIARRPSTYFPSTAKRGLLPLLHVSRPYPLWEHVHFVGAYRFEEPVIAGELRPLDATS
jgi:hypothetical protein